MSDIKDRLSEIEWGKENTCLLTINKSELYRLSLLLKDEPDLKCNLLFDICCVDYASIEPRFEIIYNIYSIKYNRRVILKVPVDSSDLYVDSIRSIWQAADWYEREIYDMFGIRFNNHPDLKRILMPVNWRGHPLRKDYPIGGEEVAFTYNRDAIDLQEFDLKELSYDGQAYIGLTPKGSSLLSTKSDDRVNPFNRQGNKRMIINMGPQHPATHGLLRLVVEIDGETVTNVEPIIGYLHTGIEKTAEQLTYQQAVTVTDRLDYLTPLGNNLAYALAVEKIMGLDIPLRAQYARVILAELSRIGSHLVWLAAQGLDVGIISLFFYCFRDRETILDIFELCAGVRMMTSYINIGGIRQDLPEGFKELVRAFIDSFPSKIDEYEKMITKNVIWRERTEGVGKLSLDDAIAHGLTGPCLRAMGLKWDIRKSNPYSSYDHFEFDIPTYKNGDVFDRYLVRIEEMRQSLKIIEQAIKRLPGGHYRSIDRKISPPPKEELGKSMESLIHHFLISSSGFPVEKGEAYSYTESPRGALGFYVVSDGGNKPYRMRLRAPSFANLQSLNLMAKGGLIADLVAIIGSIDPVLGEIDR